MPTPNLLKLTFYKVVNVEDIPELKQELKERKSKIRSWHFLREEETNKALKRGLQMLFGTKASITPSILSNLSGFSGEFEQCVFPEDVKKNAISLRTQSLGKIVLVPSPTLRNKNTFQLIGQHDENHPLYNREQEENLGLE